METIEIKKSNVQAAYAAADDKTKNVLAALFGDDVQQKDNRPVTERIKTFEDAMAELDSNHPFICEYRALCAKSDDISPDLLAYLKLRIITAALNEGWNPEFTEGEWRYFPWFYIYTQAGLDDMEDSEKKELRMIDTGDYQTEYAGFGYAYSNYAPASAPATCGSHLCLRTSDLAVYCGKQFINLWADYSLQKVKSTGIEQQPIPKF
jgi:hypothetical protein